MPARPVDASELDGLFADATAATFVLAVSGGADSVAMLRLAHLWRQQRQSAGAAAPVLIAATVDHHLRPASGDEARWVCDLAAGLGIPHHTLHWQGPHPATGLQQSARVARYALLHDLAQTFDNAVVLTAHHQDDQAETLLMRLGRGSGLDGLSAMRRRESRLFRPLLAMPRARLEATLVSLGQSWIEDPSNANTAFERVRIRNARPLLDDLGLTAPAIALSASRLLRARRALEQLTDAALRRLVDPNDGVCAALGLTDLQSEPDEIQVRVLARLLGIWGHGDPHHLLSRAEELWNRLNVDQLTPFTLGGAVCAVARGNLLIWREAGREKQPEIAVSPGTTVSWDRRYEVAFASDAMGPAVCRALGPEGVREARALGLIPNEIARPFPRSAWETVPGLWVVGQLIAIGGSAIDGTADVSIGRSKQVSIRFVHSW